MSKPTVHLVYATPNTLADKLTMRLFHRKLGHPGWDRMVWPAPLKAPLCITYQVARRLSVNWQVKLYDLRERLKIRPEAGDILLGHPWPDPKSVLWQALENEKFARRYIISPYNHDPRQIGYLAPLLERCDRYFALCGSFWTDSFHNSPLARFQDKVVRLEMGIDTADYPFLKRVFNPPGERKFFYIGRAGHEKGIDLLEQLPREVPGFQGGYISLGGEIKGWTKISEPTDLTPELMRGIARDYDVFINMSRADAQVTTVLEAMSWGFPIACTPESGYSDDKHLFSLSLDNIEQNRGVVRHLQQLENRELERLSSMNRKLVESQNSWDRFLCTLEENL